MSAAALGACALPELVRAAPARAATGDAHLVVVADQFDVNCATRYASGGWGGVGGFLRSLPGNVADVAASTIAGDLHVTIRSTLWADSIWHVVQRSDGGLTALGDVCGQAGTAPVTGSGTFGGSRLASASVNGSLYVLACDGVDLWCTVRYPAGNWSAFQSVKNLAGNPGNITDVAVAGFADGSLQVVVVNSAGDLYHTVVNANGSWGRFGYVYSQTGYVGQGSRVSAAAIGGTLHTAMTTQDRNVYHTTRQANGSWTALGDLGHGLVANDPQQTSGAWDVAVAGSADGTLQLAITDSGGYVWHTIRYTDGSWQPWGNASLAVQGPISLGSGTAVALAIE